MALLIKRYLLNVKIAVKGKIPFAEYHIRHKSAAAVTSAIIKVEKYFSFWGLSAVSFEEENPIKIRPF